MISSANLPAHFCKSAPAAVFSCLIGQPCMIAPTSTYHIQSCGLKFARHSNAFLPLEPSSTSSLGKPNCLTPQSFAGFPSATTHHGPEDQINRVFILVDFSSSARFPSKKSFSVFVRIACRRATLQADTNSEDDGRPPSQEEGQPDVRICPSLLIDVLTDVLPAIPPAPRSRR